MSAHRLISVVLACCGLLAACGGSTTTHSATSTAVAAQATAPQLSSPTQSSATAPRAATTTTTSTSSTHTTAPGTVTAPGAAATAPTAHALRVTETMHVTGSHDGYVLEAGTVRGTPIGSGTLTVRAQLAASGALVTFTVHGVQGSVVGIARMHLRFRRRTILYDGTARLVGGSGSYRAVRASGLTVTGSGDLAGTHTVLEVTGTEYD